MSFLSKTLGGLSRSYYIRQILFGSIFLAFCIFIGVDTYQRSGNISLLVMMSLFGIINLLLYPYSRFVYESIVGYIMGDNVFFGNVVFMMSVKIMTMMLCYIFAIFIAPLGLIYLYFYHSKQEKLANQQEN